MARVLTVLRREISERHRSGQSNIDIQRALNLGRAAIVRLTAEGRKMRLYWGDQPHSGRRLKLSAAQTMAARHAVTSMVSGGYDKLMGLEGAGSVLACMRWRALTLTAFMCECPSANVHTSLQTVRLISQAIQGCFAIPDQFQEARDMQVPVPSSTCGSASVDVAAIQV